MRTQYLMNLSWNRLSPLISLVLDSLWRNRIRMISKSQMGSRTMSICSKSRVIGGIIWTNCNNLTYGILGYLA